MLWRDIPDRSACRSGRVSISWLPLALAIITALLSGAVPASGKQPGRTADLAPDTSCSDRVDPDAPDADELMHDRYRLAPHPMVRLPHDLTWSEDPLRDRNWQFQFQSLDFLLPLLQATRTTGDDSYAARAVVLARSWVDASATDPAPSPFTWYEHSVALRAQVLTCLARSGVTADWLTRAIEQHGDLLADGDFIAPHGNHRLDDALGLLMVGCQMGRDAWIDLAADRIARTWPTLVERDGASTEGSVWYAAHMYQLSGRIVDGLQACGQDVPASFARRDRMPRFLALATDPDGFYTMLGDTLHEPATRFPGTQAQYPATRGRSGRPPGVRAAIYRAGYLFARTGWGTKRPMADERSMSLRFGASGFSHAHDDAGSVTLWGYARRLLIDPGMWGYEPSDPRRTWAVSRAAHNVVAVAGHTTTRGARPRLLHSRIDGRVTEALVDLPLYRGIVMHRRVLFSDREGYLVIEDTVHSKRPVTVQQLWHLMPGSRPMIQRATVRTRQGHGNVLIRQLRSIATPRIIKGATKPMQGWLGDGYRKFRPAPVVRYQASGTTIRFLTLIVPFRTGSPDVAVTQLRTTNHGFSMVVRVGDHRERVRADAAGARISSVP